MIALHLRKNFFLYHGKMMYNKNPMMTKSDACYHWFCLQCENMVCTKCGKKFHEMVAAGIFPMKNIAYLLFLDVVRWYSSETTTTMRYDDVVSRFWRTGYKLFHGRFLRFMKRNRREIIIKDSRRGCFDPAESEINFQFKK